MSHEIAGNPRDRYLLETLLSTLGLPQQFTTGADSRGSPVWPPAFPAALGGHMGLPLLSMLAREEEYQAVACDEHDRFPWASTTLRPPDLAARPLVSEHALRLLGEMERVCAESNLPMARKEFWPEAAPMAACLTHDVDVVRRGKLPRGVAVRDVTALFSDLARARVPRAAQRTAGILRTAASGQDPYWTFDRISALEKEHGYRSTYFFMAARHHREDAAYDLNRPPMARLLHDLEKSGDEIALHGGYGSWVDAEALSRLKSRLEAHLGHPVAGHRNHFLRFRVPDSWRAQEAVGFAYDATLGFHDREGFRAGHAFPFHPYDLAAGRALDLLEIPLAAMDVTLSKYRRLRGEPALEALRTVLEQTRSVHGLATLLWHNDTFYDADYPGSGHLYASALAWLSENRAWVATCAEVDRWWRARDAARLTRLDGEHRGWRLEVAMEIEGLALRLLLPDPEHDLRVVGHSSYSLRRDGPHFLLQFGRLPAGAIVEVGCGVRSSGF